ncbi:MAG: autotransporter-associated beta strand repeat-containing protein, partial [Gammaproteobacteria bacterium]
MGQGHPTTGALGSVTLRVAVSVVLCAAFSSAALAQGPTGGVVTGGSGQIVKPDDATTRIQQNSQNLALDWQTFNVAQGHTVEFVQPNAQATALNRIHDQNASQIFGAIIANGNVFLLNPNGIVFGETGSVNVNSLLATTLDVSAEDFMAGNWDFQQAAGGSNGMIVNRGLIQAARAGSVTLVAGAVSNEGVILADYGQVTLAGATRTYVDFDGDGLLRFEISGEIQANPNGVDAAVANSGTIQANGGQVLLTAQAVDAIFRSAVNHEGVISATRIERQGGVVRLGGGSGTTMVAGTIDASSADGEGGTVEITGDRVGLTAGATIDASGATGGGQVNVGGGFQGNDPNIQNATVTYVDENANIDASATDNGDGGEVIVWADDTTRFFGTIDATGGDNGGDGGFAEVSGAGHLAFNGTVDLRAPAGEVGTLLLDPTNLTISDDADANLEVVGGIFDPLNAALTNLNWTTLVAALGSADVTVTTVGSLDNEGDAGDITVVNAHTYSSANQLTLQAAGAIIVNTGATVQNDGAGDIVFDASTVDLSAPIILAGGGTLSGTAATVTVNTGGLIQNGIDVSAVGAMVSVGAGTFLEDLTITTAGLTLAGAGIGSSIIEGVADEAGLFPSADSSTNILVDADGVTIEDFTIRSPIVDAAVNEYSSGLVLSGMNITIQDNAFEIRQDGNGTFNGDTSVAIQTLSSAVDGTSDLSGLQILNNTFSYIATNGVGNGYYGIYVNPHIGGGAVTISGNTMTGRIWRGITVETGNVDVLENSITTDTLNTDGDNSGIRVVDWAGATLDDVQIARNTVAGAGGGIGFAWALDLGAGGTETLTNVAVTNNVVSGNHEDALRVGRSAANIAVSDNSLAGFTQRAIRNNDAGVLDASGNWFGSVVEATVASAMGGTGGGVDFSPYLASGTDSDVGTAGFQGDFEILHVTDAGAQTIGLIQEAIDLVDNASEGVVNVEPGTYVGDLHIDRDNVTLRGSALLGSTIRTEAFDDQSTAPWPAYQNSTGILIEANNVTIDGFRLETPAVPAGSFAALITLIGSDISITNNEFVSFQGDAAPNGIENPSTTNIMIQSIHADHAPGGSIDGLLVQGNTFTGNGMGYYGVYLNRQGVAVGDTVTIDDNTFTGNIWRAIATERGSAVITNNVINPDAAVQAVWGGAAITVGNFAAIAVDDVTITGNEIGGAGAFAHGILLGRADDDPLSNIAISNHTGDLTLVGDMSGAVDWTVSGSMDIPGDIVTTAVDDIGLPSGAVSLVSDGAGNITITGVIDTRGAANATGVGSAGGAVLIQTADGTISVGVIMTSGGANNGGGAHNGGHAGGVTLTSTGGDLITLNGSITARGGDSLSGDGGNGGNVDINGPVLLGAAITIDTRGSDDGLGGTHGTVDFSAAIDGGETLTIHSGDAGVAFNSAVGAGTPLGILTVNTSGTLTLNGNVSTADAGQFLATGGTVHLTAPVTLSTGTGTLDVGMVTVDTNRNLAVQNTAGSGGAMFESVDLNAGDLILSGVADGTITVNGFFSAGALTTGTGGGYALDFAGGGELTATVGGPTAFMNVGNLSIGANFAFASGVVSSGPPNLFITGSATLSTNAGSSIDFATTATPITLSDGVTLTLGNGVDTDIQTGTINGTADGTASSLVINTTGTATTGVVDTDIGTISITANEFTLGGGLNAAVSVGIDATTIINTGDYTVTTPALTLTDITTVGSADHPLLTSVDSLDITGDGNVWITEASGIALGSVNIGTGNFTLVATAGDILEGATDTSADITTSGAVSLTATAGNIGAAGADAIDISGTGDITTSAGGSVYFVSDVALENLVVQIGANGEFSYDDGDLVIDISGDGTDITIADYSGNGTDLVDFTFTAPGTTNIVIGNGAIADLAGGSVSLITTGDITGTGTSIDTTGTVSLTGDNIALTLAAGTLEIDATGDVTLISAGAGGITVGGAGITADGNVLLFGNSPVDVDAAIITTGDIVIAAQGGTSLDVVTINALVQATDGDVLVYAGGNIEFTALGSVVTLDTAGGGSISLYAGIDVTADNADPLLVMSVDIDGPGDASADILMDAAATISAVGGDANLVARRNVSVSTVTATGNVAVIADTPLFGLAADGTGAISAAATNLITGTEVLLAASSGIGTVGTPMSTTAGSLAARSATGGVFITETDAVTVAQLSGGALVAYGPGAIAGGASGAATTVNGVTTLTSGAIAITAGILTLDDTAASTIATAADGAIDLSLTDLDIEAGAAVDAGAGAVTIIGAGGSAIGLGTGAGALSVSDAELGLITAGGLEFVTTGAAAITVAGTTAANTDQFGALTLDSAGAVTVSAATILGGGFDAQADTDVDVQGDLTATSVSLTGDADDNGVDTVSFDGGVTVAATTGAMTLSANGNAMTGDGALTLNAADGISVNDALTTGAGAAGTLIIGADSDGDGFGTLAIADGATVSSAGTTPGTMTITAADLNLNTSGALDSGALAMTITASNDRGIRLGIGTGNMVVNDGELGRITAGSLEFVTTGGAAILITGTTAANTDQFGPLTLDGAGDVTVFGNTILGGALVVEADGNVYVNADLTADDISLNADFNADDANTTHFQNTVTVTATAGGIVLNGDGTTMTAAGALTLDAADGVTVNDNLTVATNLTVDADTDDNGSGTFTVVASTTTATTAGTIGVTAADVALAGSLDSGTATTTITASNDGDIDLGAATGGLVVDDAELGRISAGTLAFVTTGAGTIDVGGTTVANTDQFDTLSLTSAASVDFGASFTLLGSNLTVDADTVSLNGAATLDTGGGAITIAIANASTMAGVIAGSGTTLTIDGVGTLTLAGANTYDGGTTITAGTLAISSDGNLGAVPGAPDADNLTLDGGTLQTTADITLSSNRGITLGNGDGTFSVDTGTTLTVGGVITGSGDLTTSGVGTLVLGGTNTYTGQTNVDAGTLAVTVDQALGTVAGGTVVVAGATLDFRAVSYTTAEAVELNGGTLATSTGTSSFAGAITLTANSTIDVDGTQLTLTGEIGESAGTFGFDKTGLGLLILDGANTYGGTTNVVAGTLSVTDNAGLGATTNGTVVSTGATLHLNAVDVGTESVTLNGTGDGGNGALTVTGTASLAGAVVLGTGSPSIGGAGTLTLSGEISGTSLNRVGSGTLILTGVNTFTGQLTVSVGVVSLRDSAAAGTAAGGISVTGGAALELQGGITIADAITLNGDGGGTGALRNVSDDNTVSGVITLGSATTIGTLGGSLTITGGIDGTASGHDITFDGAGDAIVSTAAIAGTGTNLIKDGAGTLTLSFANTYTGTTAVNAGTLVLGADAPDGSAGALGNASSAVTVGSAGNAASLLIGGAFTVGRDVTVTGDSTVTLGGNTTDASTFSGAITLNQGVTLSAATDGTVTFSGVINDGGGSFAVTKAGDGTVVFGGANTYDGGTTINAGALTVSGATATAGTGTIAVGAHRLNVNDGATISAPITVDGGTIGNTSGSGTIATGGITLLDDSTFDVSGTGLTVSAAISGGFGVTKNGVGTLTLTGLNAYTGATTITAGTLAANSTDALGDGSGTNTLVFDGGTLQAIGAITSPLTRTVTLNSTGVIDTNGNAVSIAGLISGVGGLTKDGLGTLTLSGTANTFGGAVTISAGTLSVATIADSGTNSSLGTGNGTATITLDGGTLAITTTASTASNRPFDLTADSEIRLESTGYLNLTGAITLDSHTLTLFAPDLATLDRLGAAAISGTGGVIITGEAASSAVQFRSANTYEGLTHIQSGRLVIEHANALGTTDNGTTVDSGGTLHITAAITIAGEALTLNGNGYDGAAGALHAFSAVTWTGGVTLGSNARINVNSMLTLSGVIADGGSNFGITTAGLGTLVLTGANTYGGDTTINSAVLTVSGATATAGTGTLVVGANTLNANDGASIANAITVNGGTLGNTAGAGTIATGGVTLLGDSNLSATGLGGLTISAIITDGASAFGLATSGTGTITLSTSNTYDGLTDINGGTVVVQDATGLGTTVAGTTVGDGATLEIDGVAVGAEGVTLEDGSTLTGTGTASLDGAVSVTGDATIAGTGAFTLDGTVVQSAGTHALNITLTGGSLTFNAELTVDDLIVGTGPYDLSVLGATGTITQQATFGNDGDLTLGQAGGTQNYDGGFDTTGVSGTVTLHGTLASVDNAIDLGDVTIGSDLTINTVGTTAAAGIDADSFTGNFDLTLNAADGDIGVTGAINTSGTATDGGEVILTGNVIAVGSVNTSSTAGTAGDITFNNTAVLSLPTITATGGISGANLNFAGPVRLVANTVITTGATGGNISFAALDTNGTAHSLGLTAGTGNVTFNGIVGGGGNALGELTVLSATTVTVGAAASIATDAADVNFTASRNIVVDGDIMTGGGNITMVANGVGAGNYAGIFVGPGGAVTIDAGGGNVSLTGTGGNTNDNNAGIRVVSSGTTIRTSGAGTLTLDGTGGPGGTFLNDGIWLADATVSTVDGDLTLEGVGGTVSADNAAGVRIQAATVESTGDGNILITGNGGATQTGNARGITIYDNGVVRTTAASSGTITLNGAGGTDASGSATNAGVYLFNSTLPGHVASLGGGGIVISGWAGAGASSGFRMDAGATLGGTNIRVGAESIDLAATASISGTGSLVLNPLDGGSSIGIGDGAAGTFNLTADELGTIQDGFESITIGHHTTGSYAVQIGDASFADPVTIQAPVAGGSISTVAATTLTLNEGGTLTTAGTIALNGSVDATGQTLTLESTAAGITQPTGTVTAGALEVLNATTATLGRAGNAIGTVGANTSNAFTLVTTGTLTVGTAGATTGITTGSGGVNLTAADLAITEAITAPSQTVTIDAGAGTIDIGVDNAGTMHLANAEIALIAATTLQLDTSGDITLDATTVGTNIVNMVRLETTGAGNIIFSGNESVFNVELLAYAADRLDIQEDVTAEALYLRGDFDADADTNDDIFIADGVTLTATIGLLRLGGGNGANAGDIIADGAATLNANASVEIERPMTTGGLLTIDADTDENGAGAFTLGANGSITTGGASIDITAADLSIETSAGIDAGAGTLTFDTTDDAHFSGDGASAPGVFFVWNTELNLITADTVIFNVNGALNITPNTVIQPFTATDTDGFANLEIHATGSLGFNSSAALDAVVNGNFLLDIDGTISATNGNVTFGAGGNMTWQGGTIFVASVAVRTLDLHAQGDLTVDNNINTSLGIIFLRADFGPSDGTGDLFFGGASLTLASGADSGSLTISGENITFTGATTMDLIGDAGTTAVVTMTAQADVDLGDLSFNGDIGDFSVLFGQAGNGGELDLTGLGAVTVDGGVQSFAGGAGTDTILGPNAATSWVISGTNSGTALGAIFTFSAVENLTGGTGDDSFTISGTGELGGTIDGGTGNNTLTGNNTVNTWTIDADNGGDVTNAAVETVAFENIQNLIGGTNTDQFDLTAGVTSISGGGNTDTLSLMGSFTNPVATLTLTVEQVTNDAPGFTLTVDNLVINGFTAVGTLADPLLTTLDTLEMSGDGDVFITETNAITIQDVDVGTGDFNLIAGDVTVGATFTLQSADGTISVTGTDLILDGDIDAGVAGTVTLIGAGGIGIDLGNNPNGVAVLHVNNTELGLITAATLNVETTGAGAITIDGASSTAVRATVVDATGTGIVDVVNNPSSFGGALTLDADGGAGIFVSENLTASTDGAGNLVLGSVVTLEGNVTFDADTGDVTFDGAVNGDAQGRELTVEASGTVTFNADVGGTPDIGSILVSAATLSLAATVDIATGVDTDGPITFEVDELTLGGTNTIDAGAGTFTLRPRTDSFTIEFGSTNTALVTNVFYDSDFNSVTAGSFVVGDAAHTGDIHVTGVTAAPYALVLRNGNPGEVMLSGNYIGSGSLTVDSDLVIDGIRSVDLTNGGGAPTGADFSVTGTTDGANAALGDELTVDAGTDGVVTFTGDIGAVGGNTLNGLEVTEAETVNLSATLLDGGALTIAATNINLTGASYTLNTDGAVDLRGAIVLDNDVAITTFGSGVNAIVLDGSIDATTDGVETLSLQTATDSSINVLAVVGAGEALGGLTIVNSGGATFADTVESESVTITDSAAGATIAFQDNLTIGTGLTVSAGAAYHVSITGGTNTIA